MRAEPSQILGRVFVLFTHVRIFTCGLLFPAGLRLVFENNEAKISSERQKSKDKSEKTDALERKK